MLSVDRRDASHRERTGRMQGGGTVDPGVVVRRLVDVTGGRYAAAMGIDVDAGVEEIDRWLLAATLFGNPIPASVVARTYRSLAGAGIRTFGDVAHATWDELVARLDAGGYVRYDFRTASRLLAIAAFLTERWPDGLVATLRACDDPVLVAGMLDGLPGWGPATTRIFLRELRGVWPGAQTELDERAILAARHLGLAVPGDRRDAAPWLEQLASLGGVDPRDFEGALIRLSLAHRRRRRACPGGESCESLQAVGQRARSRRVA